MADERTVPGGPDATIGGCPGSDPAGAAGEAVPGPVGSAVEDDLEALHRWQDGLDLWVDSVLEASAADRSSTGEQAAEPGEPGPVLPPQVRADGAVDSTTKASVFSPFRVPGTRRAPDVAAAPTETPPQVEPAWRSRPVRRADGALPAAPLVPRCRERRPVEDPPPVTVAPAKATRGSHRYLSWVCLALAAVALALGFVFIRYTDDSSFMAFRYGATWVHTHHWAWDPKGPSVQGHAGFAWAALSIVPVLLHVPNELFFKCVAVGLLAGFAVWTHRLRLPRVQQFLLLATAALSPVFFIQLFSGAETVAFALAVTMLFAGLYRTGRFGPLGWATAIGLVLLRPEGLGYCAVAVLWALVLDRRALHLCGAALVTAWVGIYWAAGGEQFGYRWPNWLSVATGDGSDWDRFMAGAAVVGPVVLVAALTALAVVVLVGRNRRRPVWRRVFGPTVRRDATPLVLGLTAALVLLGGYHRWALPGDYAGRLIWQAIFPVVAVALARPLIGRRPSDAQGLRDGWAMAAVFVAAAAVVVATADRHAQQGVLLGTGAALAIGLVDRIVLRDRGATAVAAAGLAVLISWIPATDAVGFAAYRYRLQDSQVALGVLLRDSHLRGAVATADAGVLAFELPGRVIDLARRTDTDLTQDQVQVVIGVSQAPDARVIESTLGQQVADAWARSSQFEFLPGPEFAPGYWLNLWVDPAVATPAFVQALHELTQRSIVRNRHSDAHLLHHHLFDLPFLHAKRS
jgi:hypothetical protein